MAAGADPQAAEAGAVPRSVAEAGGPSRRTRSTALRVPFVQQEQNWDCGLACVLMVLGSLGAQRCDLRVMRQLCTTQSIWTIDLAHLLRAFGVDVRFCSLELGVNPQYSTESFYVDTMAEDGHRVERLFRDAATLGIVVERRSVSLEELQQLCGGGQHLVVALVDKRKLVTRLDICCGISSGYTGHYVLLCGYDAARAAFVVRDPASNRATAHLPAATLEEARRSFGTDEDLLIVAAQPLAADAEAAVLAGLAA